MLVPFHAYLKKLHVYFGVNQEFSGYESSDVTKNALPHLPATKRGRLERKRDTPPKKSPCCTSQISQSVAIGCTVGHRRYSRAIGTTCQIANRYLNLPGRQTQVDKYPPGYLSPRGTSRYARPYRCPSLRCVIRTRGRRCVDH